MLLRGNTARFFPGKEGSNYFEAAPDKSDLDAAKNFQTSGRVASIGELLVGKEVRGARRGGVRGGGGNMGTRSVCWWLGGLESLGLVQRAAWIDGHS